MPQHWDWFEELYTSRERRYHRLMDSRDDDDDCQDEDDEYESFRSRGHGGDRGYRRHDRSGGRSRAQQASRQVKGCRYICNQMVN